MPQVTANPKYPVPPEIIKVQILAQAVRSNYSFGHTGDPNPTPFSLGAAAPRQFIISFPSTDWVDPAKDSTLWMVAGLERSLDGGATWNGYGGFGSNGQPSNVAGKGGVRQPPTMAISWDGLAMQVRGTVTAGPSAFSWGIDIT